MIDSYNTYFIYHIRGVKVGCTKSLIGRRLFNENFGSKSPEQNDFSNIEILQTLINLTDKEAGDIEWMWADKLGYKRGTHYAEMMVRLSAAGKIGSISAWNQFFSKQNDDWYSDRARKAMLSVPADKRSQMARHATAHLAHEQRRANSRKYYLSMTAEERSARARIIRDGWSKESEDKVSKASKERMANKTEQQRRDFGKLGSNAAAKTLECPHCGKTASLGNSKRWHFDNCRSKVK